MGHCAGGPFPKSFRYFDDFSDVNFTTAVPEEEKVNSATVSAQNVLALIFLVPGKAAKSLPCAGIHAKAACGLPRCVIVAYGGVFEPRDECQYFGESLVRESRLGYKLNEDAEREDVLETTSEII